MRSLVALFGFVCLVAPVSADEVWSTDMGQITYLKDVGDVAVLSIDRTSAPPFLIYVPGLAGNLDSRRDFFGYWLAEEDGSCPASIAGEDGVTSDSWGGANIMFHETAFPSGFTLVLGECFETPATSSMPRP